jgi:pyruvate dehydrogenase E1 component alpha subunit
MKVEREQAQRPPLLELLRAMLRIRLFEERLAELLEVEPPKREVRCPCHLCIGQEAIAAGVCGALEAEDTVWGGHRSHGHYLAKGGDMPAMMAEIFGKVSGCSRGRGGSMHLFAPEVGILGTVPLVAATIPIAVGAGLASKLRGDRRVHVAFFGDGATEEGHFHESLNFAALYRLPVLFVCENNLYSSHMALHERRAKDNIVEAAQVHGLPGVRVDGNDVLAVHAEASDAVSRGRRGEGPTLLECRTYRWRGHVGPSWDMDVGVKRKDELEEWMSKDPIGRLGARLLEEEEGLDAIERIEREVRSEVEDAVEFARRSEFPAERGLYEHVVTAKNGDNSW